MMLGPEVAVALTIILPLTGAVVNGIVGGGAHDLFKRLWNLPREDAAEVVVAVLQSALDAVADCCQRAFDDPDQTFTKVEKNLVKTRIKQFRRSSKSISKSDAGLTQQFTEFSGAASYGSETPFDSSFGPLLDSASKDMPEAIRQALERDFVPALRMNFRKKLRDDDRVYRLWTADTLEHVFAADKSGWFGVSAESGYPDSTRIPRLGNHAIMFEMPTTIDVVSALGRLVPGAVNRSAQTSSALVGGES